MYISTYPANATAYLNSSVSSSARSEAPGFAVGGSTCAIVSTPWAIITSSAISYGCSISDLCAGTLTSIEPSYASLANICLFSKKVIIY